MDLLAEMEQAIVDGNRKEAVRLANLAIEQKLEPMAAIEALGRGIQTVGKRFAEGEMFLPELIISGETMKEAIDILDAELRRRGAARPKMARFVIGTVEGDIHSIGKTIVASLLNINGFEVIDLGTNIRSDAFLQEVQARGAEFLGLSALLTSTLPNQQRVIEAVTQAGLRGKLRVLVGGAPASQSWADKIGADGYGANAVEALELALRFHQQRR